MREIEKRLEALEARVEPTAIWIPPPGDDLAGWEMLVGNGEEISVERQQGKSNSELDLCTAQAMREAMRAMGSGYGYAVMFAFDRGGMTR